MDQLDNEGGENDGSDAHLFEMDRFDPDEDNLNEASEEKVLLDVINKKLKLKRKLKGQKDDHGGKEEACEIKEVGVNDTKAEEPERKKRKRSKKKKAGEEKPEGFTVLGDSTDGRRKKVDRVLPRWLAEPDLLEVDLASDRVPVSEAGLPAALLDRLARRAVTHLFPVQRQVIPRLLASQLAPRLRPPDLCVSAPTGSGKTLAFVLPIVASLEGRLVPRVRALAVLPTQDLALQVFKVFSAYTEGSGLRVKLLTGGDSLTGEAGLVRRGVAGRLHQIIDILVVTPGRLLHTLRDCPALDLSHLRFLVIDEADRMMSTIQHDGWLTALETAVYTRGRARPSPHLTSASLLLGPPEVPLQKLLFSATLSQDPELLEQLNLFEPKLFRCVVPAAGQTEEGEQEGPVGQFSLPSTLRQEYLACHPGRRPLLLSLLVKARGLQRVLVFVNEVATGHRLALLLTNLGHTTGELHSQVKRRRKLLHQLEAGGLQLLVCSDALARGIDVASLDGVISYDAPSHLKTYVHRAGRTARAGGQGTAITLCEANQVKGFLKMLRDGGIGGVEKVEVAEAELEAAEEGYQQSVEKTKTDLEEEKTNMQRKNTKRKLEKAKKTFNPVHMKLKS